LQRGVELLVVHGELRPLRLDQPLLQEVGAEPTFDRVARDHADDDGRDKEEIVVDENFNRRGLHPYGHKLVGDDDDQARPGGIEKPELQHGICPGDHQQETRVIAVTRSRRDDDDHRHDSQSGQDAYASHDRLHDDLEPPGEGQAEDGERGGAEDRVPDDPYPHGVAWDDIEVKDPECGIECQRQDEGEAGERQGVLDVIVDETRLEIIPEPEAAGQREDSADAGPLRRLPALGRRGPRGAAPLNESGHPRLLMLVVWPASRPDSRRRTELTVAHGDSRFFR
jgi:hypothetical protein